VSNASLAATLLELCRLENPLLASAPSLVQWQAAAGPESTATAYVEQTSWAQEGSPASSGKLGSALKGEWQLIQHEHNGPQLFDLRQDPGEEENLSGLQATRGIEKALADLLTDEGR